MMTTNGLLAFYHGATDDVSRLKVLIYILERTDRNTYLFNGSLDDIAHGAGVSFSTAFKTMQVCQQEGFIKNIRRGLWHIEQNVFEEEKDAEPFMMIRNYCR